LLWLISEPEVKVEVVAAAEFYQLEGKRIGSGSMPIYTSRKFPVYIVSNARAKELNPKRIVSTRNLSKKHLGEVLETELITDLHFGLKS
jgi:hypothetical protein